MTSTEQLRTLLKPLYEQLDGYARVVQVLGTARVTLEKKGFPLKEVTNPDLEILLRTCTENVNEFTNSGNSASLVFKMCRNLDAWIIAIMPTLLYGLPAQTSGKYGKAVRQIVGHQFKLNSAIDFGSLDALYLDDFLFQDLGVVIGINGVTFGNTVAINLAGVERDAYAPIVVLDPERLDPERISPRHIGRSATDVQLLYEGSLRYLITHESVHAFLPRLNEYSSHKALMLDLFQEILKAGSGLRGLFAKKIGTTSFPEKPASVLAYGLLSFFKEDAMAKISSAVLNGRDKSFSPDDFAFLPENTWDLAKVTADLWTSMIIQQAVNEGAAESVADALLKNDPGYRLYNSTLSFKKHSTDRRSPVYGSAVLRWKVGVPFVQRLYKHAGAQAFTLLAENPVRTAKELVNPWLYLRRVSN